jgi:hypothetical protein
MEKCDFPLIDKCCEITLNGNRAVLYTDVDLEKVSVRSLVGYMEVGSELESTFKSCVV